MKQRKPILPFEESEAEQSPAILLVQQQEQNEKELESYIEQIKTIMTQLKELRIRRVQWERELIVTGGKDHQLISKLYMAVNNIEQLERKWQDIYVKAQELSGAMKITSEQIRALL